MLFMSCWCSWWCGEVVAKVSQLYGCSFTLDVAMVLVRVTVRRTMGMN